MGNVPVVHEVRTAGQSVGKLVVGDVKGAEKAWVDYSEESVIGSGVKAASYAVQGDLQQATRCAKGMGRATGQAVCGGGLLSDVPVFKELSKCGKSLGDVIGGFDTDSARRCWTEEYVQEVRDPGAVPKALTSIGVTAGAVAVTVATGGLGTAAFVGAAAGTGAVAGGADNAIKQGIDIANGKRRKFDISDTAGAVGGGAAMGAATAAVARGIQSRAAAAEQDLSGTSQAKTGQPRPAQNAQLTEGNLARLPDRSGAGARPPAGTSVARNSSSSASTTVSTALTAASEVSLISDAYSANGQANILHDNPPRFFDEANRPLRPLQHAWDRHRQHFQNVLPRELLDGNGAPLNWNAHVAQHFANWLREQAQLGTMHDVIYRGQVGHRLIFNPRTNAGIVLRVTPHGVQHLVAAFPLSPAQLRHLLSQGGRVN